MLDAHKVNLKYSIELYFKPVWRSSDTDNEKPNNINQVYGAITLTILLLLKY